MSFVTGLTFEDENAAFFVSVEIDFKLEFASTTSVIKGPGKIILTPEKLLFLKRDRNQEPACVSMPLSLISGVDQRSPEFHVPFFGSNYVSGTCVPDSTSESRWPSSCKFFLTFSKGGFDEFQRAFSPAWKRSGHNPRREAVITQLEGAVAFRDPKDPSLIYVTDTGAEKGPDSKKDD